MVNFNVYLNMEKCISRRSRRSRSTRRTVAATARAPVSNELHADAIVESLEQNLPQAINTLVLRAIKATLQADQGQDRDQDQEHPRPEKQEEDFPLQCHYRTVQDLHGTIARSLQHSLPDLIRGAVMTALQPKQHQNRPMPEEITTQEEEPTLEDHATPDEQPIAEVQAPTDEHPNT